MDNQHLLDEFQNEVIELCETTKRDTSYNPKGFRGKVLRVGAHQATTDILDSTSDNWGGFTELVLNQRIDLSLDVLVLDAKWQSLFTDTQLKNAQRRLQRIEYHNIPEILQNTSDSKADKKAERREYTRNSLVRNSRLATQVKEMYSYKCQVCNIVLVAGDIRYAEAAHIKPIGDPHNGADSLDNILCLCPNHHKLFDLGGFLVDDNLDIPCMDSSLYMAPEHKINIENFRYHRAWFE